MPELDPSSLIYGGNPNNPGVSGLPGGTNISPAVPGAQSDSPVSSGTPTWYNQPWFQNLLSTLGTFAVSKLFGGETNAQKSLQNYSTAGFGSKGIQAFLPLALQSQFTEPYLGAGIAGIGDLINNPGGLSPGVSDAIRPRLAMESQSIGQNYRNIQSNLSGTLARGNAPVSIKGALEAALNTQQERAQREARGAALTESDQLRRQDLEQTYKILDALLQFTSSGRGQAIQGLGAATGTAQANQASNMALWSKLLQSVGQSGQGA